MSDFRVIKEKIDLDKIVNVSPGTDRTRIDRIKESIKTHGWIPDFGDLSYHGDNCQHSLPFVLYRGNKNNPDELKLPNSACRYMALRELGYKTVDAFVYTHWHYNLKYTKEEIIREAERIRQKLERNKMGRYQTIYLDYKVEIKGRDNSEEIFYSNEWDRFYYTNKRVLDVACNFGYFLFEAKKNGAREVIGFDNNPGHIEMARSFRDLLNLDVNLSVQDFWNFDWSQKFDIVFCNQCIYHFANSSLNYAPRGSGEVYRALDLICNATTNNLIMFTFVNFKDPDFNDLSNGYRPGYKTLVSDLFARGFKEVRIFHHEGAKYTVVASKQPWKYLHLREPKRLVYSDSTLIDSNKIKKWHQISKEELKGLWR